MLVLDANILIRAVLGSRVLFLLRKYSGQVEFVAPDTAFQETCEHLPGILERRGVPLAPAMELLGSLAELIQTFDSETYARFEAVARQRIALGCPIWTEDTDFFGCGVATWTTDRVELYSEQSTSEG